MRFPRPRFARPAVFALFVPPLMAGAAPGPQDAPAPHVPRPPECTVGAGRKHEQEITLSAGRYASVTVEQRGTDVTVKLFDPDGTLIVEADNDVRLQGQEQLELVAEKTGPHKLSIEAVYANVEAGACAVRIAEPRPATERERLAHQASMLYAEARALAQAGKFAEARPLAERAVTAAETVLGENSPAFVRSLDLLARIYLDQGEYAKAEPIFLRALAIQEKAPGPDYSLLPLVLNNVAYFYYARGEYSKSEALHQRALGLREEGLGPDHPIVSQSLYGLGNVAMFKGDLVRAEALHRRALRLKEEALGPDSLGVANNLTQLGQLHLRQDEYEQAEPLLLRAVAIFEKKMGAEHPNLANPLTSLGILYSDKEDFAKSESTYRRALAILEKALGPEHARVSEILNNLANMHHASGDYAKALALHQRSLAIKERVQGRWHPAMVTSLANTGRSFAALGDLAGALALQSRTEEVIERNLAYNLRTGSERQKRAYVTSLGERTSRTISLQIALPDDLRARELAVTAVLQRKGRIQDAMFDGMAALRSRLGEGDRRLLDQLNDKTSELAKLVLGGPQRMDAQEHERRIGALEEQKETLEAEIGRRSGLFVEASRPITLDAVRSLIPADAALLEFAVYRPFDPKAARSQVAYGEPRYVVYVVRSRGEVGWRELGEAKGIDAGIDALRTALRDPGRRDALRLARAVDERVMRPVRGLLGDAARLLLSPDGALGLIPFEALRDEQERFLVTRYSFTYLTSGRDLLRMQVARESRSAPLVVADPLFGSAEPGPPSTAAHVPRPAGAARKRRSVTTGPELSSVYFVPLIGAAREASSIKALFPEARVLSGTQATETALKQADAPRIVHIATHGFFLTDAPAAAETGGEATRAISVAAKVENPLLRSGLALAGANRRGSGDDDGLLTALEASGLNLWGTKLVTLSACDTGVGEVRTGEGVYGLRRSFVLAGTETLVTSLWPVNDIVTRDLMMGYYAGLKAEMGRGEALRHVQLGMLKRQDRQHPFYWASFIQTGEWASLEGRR